MRKNILSVCLMGALTFAATSSFVSCKDYDDDIENLQGQINTLENSLQEKLAAAQTAISALQAAQADMAAQLAKAATVEDVAALTAADADLKAAIAKLEAAAATKGDLVELSAKLDAALVEAKAYTDAAMALKADKADLEKVAADLQTVIANYSTLSDDVKKAVEDIAVLKAAVDGQKAALESQNQELKKAIADGDAATLAAAEKAVADLKAAVDAKDAELKGLIEAAAAKAEADLKDEIAKVKAELSGKADLAAVNTLSTKVAALEEKVGETVALVNAVSNKVDVMTAALTKALRSLVFIPELYVDGIETIVYPYLEDTTLYEVGAGKLTRTRYDRQGNAVEQVISYNGDYQITLKSSKFVYGPAMGVDYHMNPSVATPAYADVKGYAENEVDAITRVTEGKLVISSPEKYANGDQLYATKNGIVTAGLKIEHPDLLWQNGPKGTAEGETGKVSAGKENIIALQINSHLDKSEGKDTVITSDYAMLYPEKMYIEGMVWHSTNNKLWHKNTATSDEKVHHWTAYTNEGEANICGKVHVWDTPEEALLDNQGNLVELRYNDAAGIKLEDYLGIHIYRESVLKANQMTATMYKFTSKEFARLGLTYEFSLIDYTIDKNVTHDSKYATLDAATGTIIARNVLADGSTVDTESKTAVDREPLVRVLVKHGNNVILDGFILVHITEKTPDPVNPEHNDKTIDFKKGAINFDLCNGGMAVASNWSEFSYIVLTEGLENMEKGMFDKLYDFEMLQERHESAETDGDWIRINHYNNDKDKNNGQYGKMWYRYDKLGTTNHDFMWTLSEAELEALTHHVTTWPVTLTTYVRYNEKEGAVGAPYNHVYLKFEVTITRDDVATATWKEKIHNYWYDRVSGARNAGENAIALNVGEPTDGGNINSWNRTIMSTLVQNKLVVTGGRDGIFYFTPLTASIKCLNGDTYTITPQRGAGDDEYNKLACLYSNDSHRWVITDGASDIEAINNILNTCAIDYSKGVYTNDKLFAVKSGVYTEIATLNQATGEITLIHNDVAELLVNAIGYAEDHANIASKLRGEIGVIAKNTCGVAVKVKEPVFLAAWERPINPAWECAHDFVDAKSNGNILLLADIIKFYDWRGPEIDENDPIEGWRGNMERPSTKWLWAYYGIHAIDVNCTPAAVMTNMHQTSPDKFVKMNTVTTQARLYAGVNEEQWKRYEFDLTQYNSAAASNDLWQIFENLEGVHTAEKAQFGVIVYNNNGDNVKEFDVKVPVTVHYAWGSFTEFVQIHIRKSIGN